MTSPWRQRAMTTLSQRPCALTEPFGAPAPALGEQDDRPREECGVFGIFNAPENEAAPIIALGLHALQHRGQEAAGIAAFEEESGQARTERHLGLVGDYFASEAPLQRLYGSAGIGHVRYSTQGGTELRNVQPLYADLDCGGLAMAHNGNLTNARTRRRELVEQGCIFQSTSDTELFIQLTARSRYVQFEDRFIDALRRVEGAYALVAMARDPSFGLCLMGARDPLGIRPLLLGDLDGAPILASETCALDIIGATFVRDIEPGEVIICSKAGVRSLRPFPQRPARLCIFEYIYFARPDSIVEGRSVYEVRKQIGRQLAKESHVPADVVVPIPDSGVPAAIGFAQEAGLPFEVGIIRNHYVGRTFIEPKQSMRDLGVKKKHNVNVSQLKDKRVVLVDDSIVRGTTSLKIAQMVRDAGAKEVHLRVASPPIAYPDFYGIDTPTQDNLLAANRTLSEMRDDIGVDSLEFISIEGLYKALGYDGRDDGDPQFTDHCFTGDYPTPLTDVSGGAADDLQLSFLKDSL